MIRRALSAALLSAFLAGSALAQAPFAQIAPTPPTADNGDRIATTAWVNNFVNAGLPLASGKIWIGSVGNIAAAQTPSGDLTVSNAGVFTFGTVNANVGSFGSATLCPTVTVNAKGLITAASAATCTPGVGSITGLGTGIAVALAINVGSAGAPVLFNGAGGTPSAIALANGTGLPISTGVSGLAAGVATFLATSSSANLRAALTDETGTGAAYFQGGDIGTPSAGVATNITALNATQLTTGSVPPARLSLSQITNSLGANVALNNTANYFDGPSIAQGVTGTWFASGVVTLQDPSALGSTMDCKLWDGTTVIASGRQAAFNSAADVTIGLSGFLASPAGNIRISCKDASTTTGLIIFNATGSSKDSTVSAFRIN